MPHAELKYSPDIELNVPVLLRRIEEIFQAHDATSGDCKGRAYRADQAHHTHLIAHISMLPKPHRDADFVSALRSDLQAAIAAALPRPCWLSLDLSFSSNTYLTEHLT